MKLALYTRVSTAAQLDGQGLDVQEADCRALAAALGHTIVLDCCDAAISGTLDATDRPGLTAALSAVQAGDVDGIICASLSRIGRTLTVQEAALALVFAAGGRMITVAEGDVPADDPNDPMRKMLRQIIGAVHEMERATIALRLKKGRASARSKGQYGGGFVPMGRQVVHDPTTGRPQWRDDAEQLAAIARMHALRAQGHTLRSIAAQLTAEGVPVARRGLWTAATVSRILARSESVGAAA
jgi:DNA invertase Pin-like site-specific DNA recombinase